MFFQRRKTGPEYYLERGEECLSRGDYHWALESFSKALEFNPDLETAYYRRAEAYKGLGKKREAVWDYVRFLETDHRLPGMAQDLQEALKEGLNVARMDWQRNTAKQEILSFGVPSLLEELIRGYDPDGEYSDIGFYALALSGMDVGFPKNSYYTGFIHLLRRDYDKALKELDEAMMADPENPDAYYLRGAAYMGKARIAERKASVPGGFEAVKEILDLACLDFKEAVRREPRWRICPGCGYRMSSVARYCMRCGVKLLTG